VHRTPRHRVPRQEYAQRLGNPLFGGLQLGYRRDQFTFITRIRHNPIMTGLVTECKLLMVFDIETVLH
jgi:hypothetical protein